jgi:copper homeostasis protein
MRLEVIASSLDDALAAEAGGADRIELVRDLPSGGLTPPMDLIDAVLARVRIPVRVMVRETLSHVVSDPRDRSRLIAAAHALEGRPIDGIVCGAVADGAVDRQLVEEVLDASAANHATFHRAFESVIDPVAALDELGGIRRIDRVLTNGGEGTWAARTARLKRWAAASPPHVGILLGGGVTREVLKSLPSITGLHEVHVGRAAREPETDDGRVVVQKVEALAALLHALAAE